MGMSLDFGYGFIFKSKESIHEFEDHERNDDGNEILLDPPIKGLTLLCDDMNDEVIFVFGNLPISDGYFYGGLTCINPKLPDEKQILKLREDFKNFINDEKTIEDFRDPNNWIETFYILSGD